LLNSKIAKQANKIGKEERQMTENQTEQLHVLVDYFGRIADIARLNPPPGPNAANGYFREKMLHDSRLRQIRIDLRDVKYAEGGTEGGTNGIRNMSMAIDTIWDAFAESPNYYSDAGRSLPLFITLLQASKNQVMALGAAIAHFIASEGGAQSIEELSTAAKALLDQLEHSGLVVKGRHANGHISVGVKRTAQGTIQRIVDDSAQFGDHEKKVAERVKKICELLLELPTDNHDPWLRADWQVRFGQICDAGQVMLKELL
jgi:hypothetical protein